MTSCTQDFTWKAGNSLTVGNGVIAVADGHKVGSSGRAPPCQRVVDARLHKLQVNFFRKSGGRSATQIMPF